MSHRDLLIELGTEELPPKALKKLSAAFKVGVEAGLKKSELEFSAIKSYAAPRRLALLISGLAERQADKTVERRGPAVTAAFGEDGCPTPAASGFARSCGVEVEALEKFETPKGAWLVFKNEEQGKAAQTLIPAIVETALNQLPIPKRMRWGALDAEFVRPVHWLVLLFGDEVIDAEILAVKSGRETRGHRFHHPDSIYIGTPSDYEELLYSEGKVIADFERRAKAVHGQVEEAAAKTEGRAVIDPALLDEVTAMVEWPVAVLGNFEERFLDVPAEALVSTMKANQKYFHLVSKSEQLLPHFITISNIESKDPDKVREGNERVVRPRLADAEFFWKQDKKKKLADHQAGLKKVVFQKKLGTLHEKSNRVAKLAAQLAEQLGSDRTEAERAALLGKCDLMTEMVLEFPELQGIMGRYYAGHDKEPGDIAAALDEQYMPRFAGDQLPETKTGQALALAERLDTLVGIFGIGQPPTGSKDPFALRRATLGVMRILIEKELDIDLHAMLEKAVANCTGLFETKGVVDQVFDFCMERLRAYYQDEGISHDVFDAVLARHPHSPLDFAQRIHAVSAFRKMAEAESLAAANKRIGNILKKNEGDIPQLVDTALLIESEEKSLLTAMEAIAEKVIPLIDARDYQPAMQELAKLRETVDAFFDKVMVMADDIQVRQNRLALLQKMHQLFMGIADLSCLQGSK